MERDTSNAIFTLKGRFAFLSVDQTGVHISYSKTLAKADKTIPFHQIVSIEVKKPGAYDGSIYFKTSESTGETYSDDQDIAFDDNCIVFLGEEKYQTALKIKRYIEQKQASRQMTPIFSSSATEEG